MSRRREMFPHDRSNDGHFSPAPKGNTGDGLRLGEEVGAVAEKGYPNAAAWVPVSRVPRRDGSYGVFPHFIDRAKPGLIAVLPNGKRFVNEANSYHDFCQALFAAVGTDAAARAYLVVDQPFLTRYGLGFVKPFPVPVGGNIRSGYLKTGKPLQSLPAPQVSMPRLSKQLWISGTKTSPMERTRPSGKVRPPTIGLMEIRISNPIHVWRRLQRAHSMPSRLLLAISAPLRVCAQIGTAGSPIMKADRSRPLRSRQRSEQHYGRQLPRRRHHLGASAYIRLYRSQTSRGAFSQREMLSISLTAVNGSSGPSPRKFQDRRRTEGLHGSSVQAIWDGTSS